MVTAAGVASALEWILAGLVVGGAFWAASLGLRLYRPVLAAPRYDAQAEGTEQQNRDGPRTGYFFGTIFI